MEGIEKGEDLTQSTRCMGEKSARIGQSEEREFNLLEHLIGCNNIAEEERCFLEKSKSSKKNESSEIEIVISRATILSCPTYETLIWDVLEHKDLL